MGNLQVRKFLDVPEKNIPPFAILENYTNKENTYENSYASFFRDPVLKEFFSKAGVTEKDLQDKETREFIYNFIVHHESVTGCRRDDTFRTIKSDELYQQSLNNSGLINMEDLNRNSVKRSSTHSKKVVNKIDIEGPQHFIHKAHVGVLREEYNLNFKDPVFLKFLEKAGVSESQLEDLELRVVISDFIHHNGGMDAVREEMKYFKLD